MYAVHDILAKVRCSSPFSVTCLIADGLSLSSHLLSKPVFGLWLLVVYSSFPEDEGGAVLPESWIQPSAQSYGAVRIGDE
jgi:hypothetical protein